MASSLLAAVQVRMGRAKLVAGQAYPQIPSHLAGASMPGNGLVATLDECRGSRPHIAKLAADIAHLRLLPAWDSLTLERPPAASMGKLSARTVATKSDGAQ